MTTDLAPDCTVDDYTVGDVVAFLAPDETRLGRAGWAAPAGALARVVGIDMSWWHGVLVVEWRDRKHGQNDGGYPPYMFELHQRQPDLLELLEVSA